MLTWGPLSQPGSGGHRATSPWCNPGRRVKLFVLEQVSWEFAKRVSGTSTFGDPGARQGFVGGRPTQVSL